MVAERGRQCYIFAVGGAKPVQLSSLVDGRQGADSPSLPGSPPPSSLNFFLRNFPTCPSTPTFQCTILLPSIGLPNLIQACSPHSSHCFATSVSLAPPFFSYLLTLSFFPHSLPSHLDFLYRPHSPRSNTHGTCAPTTTAPSAHYHSRNYL